MFNTLTRRHLVYVVESELFRMPDIHDREEKQREQTWIIGLGKEGNSRS